MSLRIALVALCIAPFASQAQADDLYADHTENAEYVCHTRGDNGKEDNGKIFIDIDGKIEMNKSSETILAMPMPGSPIFKTVLVGYSRPRCINACVDGLSFEFKMPVGDTPVIRIEMKKKKNLVTAKIKTPDGTSTLRCELNEVE